MIDKKANKEAGINVIKTICDEAIDHEWSWTSFCMRVREALNIETYLRFNVNSTPVGAPNGPKYSTDKKVAAIELLDAAYDVVELYSPTSPYGIAWRASWLKKAKELGAHPSW